MPRFRSRFGFAVAALAAGAAGAACTALTDTTTDTTNASGQPVLEIDPATFLGDVLCADLPGAMQSYVATFIDLGPEPDDAGIASMPGYPITLSSSPATSCSQRVAFSQGVSGHRYVVEIDGYEQPPAALAAVCSVRPPYAKCAGSDPNTDPDGGPDLDRAPRGNGICSADSDCFMLGCYGRCVEKQAETIPDGGTHCSANTAAGTIRVCDYQTVEGDRRQIDPSTGATILPRWVTPTGLPCGHGNLVTASDWEKVDIGPCELVDNGGTTPTGIRLDLAATLGSFACAGGAGAAAVVDHFQVTTEPDLGAQTAACSADASLTWASNVTPDQSYELTVQAFAAGSTDGPLQARCFATAEAGVIVMATCDPLAKFP
jgi:hypothetical protein